MTRTTIVAGGIICSILLVLLFSLPGQVVVWLDVQTFEKIRQHRKPIPGTDIPAYSFQENVNPTNISDFLSEHVTPELDAKKRVLVRIVRWSRSGDGPGAPIDRILYGGEREKRWIEWASNNPDAAVDLFSQVTQSLMNDDVDRAFKLLLDAQPWADTP